MEAKCLELRKPRPADWDRQAKELQIFRAGVLFGRSRFLTRAEFEAFQQCSQASLSLLARIKSELLGEKLVTKAAFTNSEACTVAFCNVVCGM